MTDRGMNTLTSRGLEEPAHASRGLEEPFFQLCCCVSFLFLWEIGFGCTYYYVLRVPYSCGVVLVFLVLAENTFLCYVETREDANKKRIRMIDCTHTNSYVVTHMCQFVASTTAPYLDFFINITCQRFLPSYLEAESRK